MVWIIIIGVYIDGKRENSNSNWINLNKKRNVEIIFFYFIFVVEFVLEYWYCLDDSDWIYFGLWEEVFLVKLLVGEIVFDV